MASDFNIYNYLSNLSYINKDFNSIWEEIIDFVPKLTNKWKPGEANESDPLVVLLKELGILGDKLNYNIDKNTLEQFPDLLTQLRTAYSVFKSMGYNPSWYRSATTNLSIIYNGATPSTTQEDGSSYNSGSFKIPKFTQVSNEDHSQIYTTLEDVTFDIGVQTVRNPIIIEGTCNDFDINGNTLITSNNLDSQNRLYFVQSNVAQNGIFISDATNNFEDIVIEDYTNTSIDTIGDNNNINRGEIQVWTRVDNLYQYLSGNKIFKFGIDPTNGSAYIQFPDDASTLIGNGIYIKYILSSGSQGNIISKTIDSFLNEPKFPYFVSENGILTNRDTSLTFASDNFTLNNSITTQNGKDPETIEEMQRNYERVVGTFNTLVTLRDYENYIYNAENEIGNHIVSNVRVGDRSTDLYKSYKYVTQTNTGEIRQVTERSPLDSGESLKAWDITLYALNARDNINSYSDFKQTFNIIQNTQGIQNNIDTVKSMNHDIDDNGQNPIFVDYTLKGQIYLQRSLSATEAKEVENNIQLAIYRNFNSRELNWGEPINYQKLVETVKNSDSRIQYVAINPVEYTYNSNTGTGINDNTIKKLAIIAGVTPWTQYSDFKYYYVSTDGSKNSSVNIYPGANDGKITKIIPHSKFIDGEGKEEQNSCEIQKNETLSILVPGYRTGTSYSNYFYAVFGKKGNNDKISDYSNPVLTKIDDVEGPINGYFYTDEDGEPLNKEGFPVYKEGESKGKQIPDEAKRTIIYNNKYILLDTPYTLDKDECIAIYDTRDNAESKKYKKAAYLIDSGTTVTISSTDNKYKDNGIPSGEIVNMGSKTTISVIEPDINIVENPRATSTEDERHQITIKTNSEDLINALAAQAKNNWGGELKYTLNIGEYLLYSYYNAEENVVLEVGIIGEGNTLSFTSQPTSPASTDDYKKDGLIDNSLSDIDSEVGESASHSGIRIKSGSLKYRVNNIYSFGEGYKITLEDGTWGTGYIDGVKALSTDINSITYEYTDPNTQDKTEGKLPGLSNGDYYSYTYQLALILTPGEAQELQKNQQVVLKYSGGKPDQEITCNAESNTLIQSNVTILYSGGSGINVDENINDLKISVLSGTLADDPENGVILNSSGSYFHDLPSNKTIKIAGDDFIGGFIVPIIEENVESIKYLLINKNTSINLSNIDNPASTLQPKEKFNFTKIGPIYAFLSTAKYFDGSNDKSLVFRDGVNVEVMDSNTYFYDTLNFCPIYRPTGNELIEDPTKAESFFKPKHPLNRYVLPRLYVNDSNKTPLDELKIDDKSIRG